MDEPEDNGNGEDISRKLTTTTASSKEKRKAKRAEALSDAGYRAGQCAKHVIDWAIMLPGDITLSLSKGFHNAPKLYHDRMVEAFPKVIGIRSGFRAAGTVSSSLHPNTYCMCASTLTSLGIHKRLLPRPNRPNNPTPRRLSTLRSNRSPQRRGKRYRGCNPETCSWYFPSFALIFPQNIFTNNLGRNLGPSRLPPRRDPQEPAKIAVAELDEAFYRREDCTGD